MSFEGHSLTSADIPRLAGIRQVSSAGLFLRLLWLIYVFLFLLAYGEAVLAPGVGCGLSTLHHSAHWSQAARWGL